MGSLKHPKNSHITRCKARGFFAFAHMHYFLITGVMSRSVLPKNDAVSNLSGYSGELEHPDPETDTADTIPDWWCHPCEALPVLCLSVALQSAAAGTHTYVHTQTHTHLSVRFCICHSGSDTANGTESYFLVFKPNWCPNSHSRLARGQTGEDRQRLLHSTVYSQSASMCCKCTGICLGDINAGSDRIYVLRKHILHRSSHLGDGAEHAAHISQQIV